MAELNLSDLLGALSGANPLGPMLRSVEQFRRAVDDLFGAVEAFTTTMNQMNAVAERVNRLLDDVEEPIRAVVPRISSTVRTAEVLVDQLTGPIERIAPLLSSAADSFGRVNLGRIPEQFSEILDGLGELTKRLAPLGQLAEGAGGLLRFGGLRAAFGGAAEPPPPPPPPARTRASRPAPAPTPAKQAAKPVVKPVVKAAATRSSAPKPVRNTPAAKQVATKAGASRSVPPKRSGTSSPRRSG